MALQQDLPPEARSADPAWEGDPRPPHAWWRVPAVLALALLSALVVRAPAPDADTPAGLEVSTEQPAADPLPEPAPASGVVALHALSTAGLGARVEPVELHLDGRRLRTAMSSRGRQLLAVGLENPLTGEAQVQVRDSSGLRLVAELGPVPGPLEHLSVSEDGRAVVWFQPAGPHGEARAHHQTLDGAATAIPLPEGFEVRDMRGLRDGRVALLGTDPAGPRGSVRVLVHQEEAGIIVDTTVDVGEGAAPGMVNGSSVVHPRAAHVWDDRRLRLHLVHAAEEALTTVDLRSGAAVRGAEGADHSAAGVVRRAAVLLADSDQVVATGDIVRPNPAQGISRDATLPLEPLVLRMARDGDGGGLTRGAASGGAVLAAGPSQAVIAEPVRAHGGSAATIVRTVDAGLATTWSTQVEGAVTAAALNHKETHLLLVRDVAGATVVSEHPLDGGEVVVRAYAEDAEVHLAAVVVIEHR